MTGTNVVAAKQRLVRICDLLLVDCEVSYSYVGNVANAARDYVYLGSTVTSPVKLMAFRDEVGGRIQRSEDPSVILAIDIFRPGEQTVEATEERAAEVGALIEDSIATDETLGGLANLKLAQIVSFKLASWVDDAGAHTTLDYTIQLTSHLR